MGAVAPRFAVTLGPRRIPEQATGHFGQQARPISLRLCFSHLREPLHSRDRLVVKSWSYALGGSRLPPRDSRAPLALGNSSCLLIVEGVCCFLTTLREESGVRFLNRDFNDLQKQVDNFSSVPVNERASLPARQMQLLIKSVAVLEGHLDNMQDQLVDFRRRLDGGRPADRPDKNYPTTGEDS